MARSMSTSNALLMALILGFVTGFLAVALTMRQPSPVVIHGAYAGAASPAG